MIFDEFTIKTLIRPVVDFPKPGVIFRDITPLFQSPRALRMVADSFIQRYVEADFSHIGAMDARGFLIGSIIAYELNKPLILFRKQGKLPAAQLVRRMGASIIEAAAIIDLPELGGSQKLQDSGIPTFALTSFALTDQ